MSGDGVYDNTSQWMNRSNSDTSYVRPSAFQTFLVASLTAEMFFMVMGTFLNLWFLVAILLSPEMRGRMRNKVVCSTLIVHLTESLVVCPLSAGRILAIITDTYISLNCYYETVHNNLYHIQDFVANWLVVILLCVFIAQVLEFEPQINPIWINILTFIILISPWVFSILFVPLTMHSYYKRLYGEETCFISTVQAIKVYKSLDTIVPQLLSCILLVIAVLLRYRRDPQGHLVDHFRVQLIDEARQVDPAIAFVAILITSVICDFFLLVVFMSPLTFIKLGLKAWLYLYVAFSTVALARAVFVPLVCLLFPDIRERIKTWRPWHGSSRNTDLVITYQKEASS